jgi:hypothetical protein
VRDARQPTDDDRVDGEEPPHPQRGGDHERQDLQHIAESPPHRELTERPARLTRECSVGEPAREDDESELVDGREQRIPDRGAIGDFEPEHRCRHGERRHEESPPRLDHRRLQ